MASMPNNMIEFHVHAITVRTVHISNSITKSVKRFERSNGQDTALYKNYLYFYLFFLCFPFCKGDAWSSCHSDVRLLL